MDLCYYLTANGLFSSKIFFISFFFLSHNAVYTLVRLGGQTHTNNVFKPSYHSILCLPVLVSHSSYSCLRHITLPLATKLCFKQRNSRHSLDSRHYSRQPDLKRACIITVWVSRSSLLLQTRV